ncbi:MAG: HNH endonuclease signature motif containing protein [Nitrososphaera sp.]
MRSRIWDVMNANGWRELDDFSLELSQKIAEKMVARKRITLSQIISSVRTNFFTSNKISRAKFKRELYDATRDLTELYVPVRGKKIQKSVRLDQKELPRNDFSEDVKKQVLRNQDHCCAICGRLLNVVDWDHKDGDRSNNDISNAGALCPICHASISRKRQMGIKQT